MSIRPLPTCGKRLSRWKSRTSNWTWRKNELRTPLNGVIGFTRLTLKTDLNTTQRDHLTTIERSANNLLAIINDVLDFSKLEAGKLILESIPFLLRTSLDEVVTLLAHSAHDKGLELTLNIKNDVPDNVIGDPLRLQQIITNLMGNAIKFTEHGNIDVLVEQRAISNSRVQIEVQIHDTGIGIPERDQSRLFQAFRQADASISRRHGGTGLGLVITQRLVKEMGGDISFHSQPNRGSTFWFHISLDLNPIACQRSAWRAKSWPILKPTRRRRRARWSYWRQRRWRWSIVRR